MILIGNAINTAWLAEAAGALLAARQAEQDRIAAEAHGAAQAQLEEPCCRRMRYPTIR